MSMHWQISCAQRQHVQILTPENVFSAAVVVILPDAAL
jgi:hypothetical protein